MVHITSSPFASKPNAAARGGPRPELSKATGRADSGMVIGSVAGCGGSGGAVRPAADVAADEGVAGVGDRADGLVSASASATALVSVTVTAEWHATRSLDVFKEARD